MLLLQRITLPSRLRSLIAAAIVPIGLLAVGVAQAEQVPVTQDTFVSGFPSQVNDNKGGLSILTVAGNGPRIAFVEFDLSGQAGIVTSALLTLNVRTVTTPGTVDLHVVQASWDENSMTFVNRPGFNPVAYSVAVAGADANGSVSLDITALAQGWVDDANSNHGLALVANGARVDLGTQEGGLGATLDLSVNPYGIAIASVIVSPTQLSIQGENFDNGYLPLVTLGDFGPLSVLTPSTGAMILADLPLPQPAPGDYLLTVTTGPNPGQLLTYDLTIGGQGPQGDQGPQGKIGPQGDEGPRGAQGVQGKEGPQGDLGFQGPQGKEGPQGDPGTTGEQGEAGPIGPVGGTGDNVVFDQLPINNMQPYAVVNYIIATVGTYPSRDSLDPFIGEIIMFAGNFAPRGWAFCDGQLLAISQNSALFSLLGTMYGGDGRTTFGLPDLRGRTPLHEGQGPGLSPRRQGETGGTESSDQPEHNHLHTAPPPPPPED